MHENHSSVILSKTREIALAIATNNTAQIPINNDLPMLKSYLPKDLSHCFKVIKIIAGTSNIYPKKLIQITLMNI